MEQIKISNPFFDASLSIEERLDWLLSELTMDEKLRCMSGHAPDIERLGIKGVGVGGEAAHGVQARNDQIIHGEAGVPEPTTSFPQPIGMSATWDTELLEKAGMVVGNEARVLSHRHEGRGLSRWAPTIDLARDPRWGRTEECYGEDPVQVGAMASAYIRGMQGNHPKYLRTAATLKHFYANNTELGRGWKNSSVDPRNRYELYLEPFRRAIEDGGAEAVMTAYNRINGVPAMLNPEVQNILKDQYGLRHAVCDGGAMELVVSRQHYFGMHAQTLAAAVKAGVDSMSDNPQTVEQAARDAYEMGLMTEEDFDRAIRNMFRTKLRLGLYDATPGNPYDNVTEDDLNSEFHQEICREVSRESIVLLKNEGGMLPLAGDTSAEAMAVVGPVADVWFQDWYGGKAYRETTLYQELSKLLKGKPSYADGYDRVMFKLDGKGLAVDEQNQLILSDTPDVFVLQEWGEGSCSIYCPRTGSYLRGKFEDSPEIPAGDGRILADRKMIFSWFSMEVFRLERLKDGKIRLANRFSVPLSVREDGLLAAQGGKAPAEFVPEIVEDGIQTALDAVKGREKVILALGCHPMINAKEEIDRKTIRLPERQQRLLDEVYRANPNVVLVLFSNYAYAADGAFGEVPAILWSATGSQEMGSAMAETILGDSAPAGRLNLTWYAGDEQLPDIDDYDIIRGKRTYRYFDGDVLYPFGHGLTYTEFEYSELEVSLEDHARIRVSLKLTNKGRRTSDEVVQIYAAAPKSRVEKPLRQLLGFERVKNIAPGECRQVSLTIPVEELRFYDVISRKLMVEEGIYRIGAGRSSQNILLWRELSVPGQRTGLRDGGKRTGADHYDDCGNVSLVEGEMGFTAVTAREPGKESTLTYRDFAGAKWNALHLFLKSGSGCKIRVYIDGEEAGEWQGDTAGRERGFVFPAPELLKDNEDRIAQQRPIFEEVAVLLSEDAAAKVQVGHPAELKLALEGDFKLCCLWFS